MKSLYAQYILEREGFEIIEDEHGFATYRIKGEECYLRDVFIKPEFRQTGVGRSYVEKISDIAKVAGCKLLTTTACPFSEGVTESVTAILKVGFKIHSTGADRIVFYKGL